jgi:hypothetical protein
MLPLKLYFIFLKTNVSVKVIYKYTIMHLKMSDEQLSIYLFSLCFCLTHYQHSRDHNNGDFPSLLVNESSGVPPCITSGWPE